MSPFGCEHEDLVLEDVELDALDELGRVADVALPLHELAQPGELRVVLAVGLRAFLVAPVGGDADLAHLVHLLGPDLDLQRLAVERDDRRVERLVEVVLRDGDVVVELARDRPPQRVHDAECRVTVAHVLDEQADGVDVVDLAELRALALHLLPDAVDVFRAALQVGFDAGLRQPRPELGDRPVDVALAALAARVEQLRQLAEALGVERLEREVLEFPLHLPDAEALRERRVDLEGLAGDALLLLGRQAVQRAHVVEAVGELDQDDPDVLGHREQHLADVLGLLLLVAVGTELRQLRDTIHELGDLCPEALLDVGQAVLGVLGDIVEQGRLDGDGFDAEVGEDLGARDRVGDVQLTGRPKLAGVSVDRERERFLDLREVRVGVVLGDGRQQRGLEGLEVDRRLLGDRLRGRGGRRGRAGGTARRSALGLGLGLRGGLGLGAGRRGRHGRRIARRPLRSRDQP